VLQLLYDERKGKPTHSARLVDHSHAVLLQVAGLEGEFVDCAGNKLRITATKRTWSATLEFVGASIQTMGVEWWEVRGEHRPAGVGLLPDDPRDKMLDLPEFAAKGQIVE